MASPAEVLRESVVHELDPEGQGSKFPRFSEYISGSNDIEPEKIGPLKDELLQIARAFEEGMPLSSPTVEVSVPTHETGYFSLLGVVEKDARETIGNLLGDMLDQCDLAILAKGGFGKHSPSVEALFKAQEQLRQTPVTVFIPMSNGETIELQAVTYDSNNNPIHHIIVDGMWIPYRAIGLVFVKEKDIFFAFQSTMDYDSGNWTDKFDVGLLPELLENSSLFQKAYERLTGKKFDPTDIKEDDELIELIKNSPFFQQALQRICARWVL